MRTNLFIIVFLILLSCFSASTNIENKIELSRNDSIFMLIDSMNFQYPDLIKAQVIIETGNFTSKNYRIRNNLFGMKFPGKRPTTAIGKSKNYGYAIYEDFKASIEDRFIYDTIIMKNLSREQYINKLNRIYAKDENYDTKLKKISKQFVD